METSFFDKLRDDFLNKVVSKGICKEKAKKFIDTKGMYSTTSENLITTFINNPNDFINCLREQE